MLGGGEIRMAVLLWEPLLGVFLKWHELSFVAAPIRLRAELCACVAVFTGSGDACARAFNSRSGVLQKIFRGHKFIINCIQVGNLSPVLAPLCSMGTVQQLSAALG